MSKLFNPTPIFDIATVTGIGDYVVRSEESRAVFLVASKAFLVVGHNTIELRTDSELRKLLTEKYESVMESRYFGRGGIEIVLAGRQLSPAELCDLVRLSYNLTATPPTEIA